MSRINANQTSNPPQRMREDIVRVAHPVLGSSRMTGRAPCPEILIALSLRLTVHTLLGIALRSLWRLS